MKRLTLLRHAKSRQDDTGTRDFDRALDTRGKHAAYIIGVHVRSRQVAFDWIVASPATRVRETMAIFVGPLDPPPPEPVWDRRTYLAPATTLLDIIRETPAQANHLLLVGHNPGIQELAMLLAQGQRDTVYASLVEKYPTCALACMRLECDEWSDATVGGGHIERFVRPRDLDIALGPDN